MQDDVGILLTKVDLAKSATRYSDMRMYIVELVCTLAHTRPLSSEERTCLSVAHKSEVEMRRASLRVLMGLSKDESLRGRRRELVEEYQYLIQNEVVEICESFIDLITNEILPFEITEENKCFFYKLLGDYNRYICETSTGQKRGNAIAECHRCYSEAVQISAANFPHIHPIRLGVALNYSVFYYEGLGDVEKACDMAKSAFEDGIGELEAVSDANYKDSHLIMQLLRDNFTLWTCDLQNSTNNAQ